MVPLSTTASAQLLLQSVFLLTIEGKTVTRNRNYNDEPQWSCLTSKQTNTKLTLSAATLGCSLIYNESAQQEALQIFNLAGFYTGCPSWRNSKEMCISSWDQAWDFLLVKQMCKLLHYGAKGAFDQAWNAMLLPAGVSDLTI